MANLGVEGPTKTARKIKMLEFGAPKNIERWRDGKNEPDFDATIALLLAGGWIKEKQLSQDLERAAAALAQERAEEAAQSVAPPTESAPARRPRAKPQGN